LGWRGWVRLVPAGVGYLPCRRRQLMPLTERRGVAGAQIDLILSAIQPEPHGLVRRATIKIVLQRDSNLLCHPGLLTPNRLPAPYKINSDHRLSPRPRSPAAHRMHSPPVPPRLATAREQQPAPDPRHDRTFIPRWVLHRHAVEPMVHWL
jgi:hypothetical protein